MPDVAVPPSTVQVWWARPAAAAGWHVGLLSEAERRRRELFHRAVDRDRFTVGVALSRLVLAAAVGVEPGALEIVRDCLRCGATDHGKPRLRGPAGVPEFSVAHGGQHVVLAVARGAIGVDIEARAGMPGAAELGNAVLAPAERTRLTGRSAEQQHEELLAAWVRKEAVLKSTGDGLAVEMVALTVAAAAEPAEVRSTRPPLPARERFTLLDLWPDGKHRAAVATVDQPGTAVIEHDGAALLS